MGDAHRPRIHWCLFRFVKERLSLLVLSQVSSLVLGVSVSGGVIGTCRYRNTSTSQVFAESNFGLPLEIFQICFKV